MLAYFDTSSLVPLLIRENATRECTAAWNRAHLVISTELAYVEVHAALAQAARRDRVTPAEHRRALANFEAMWADITHCPADDAIIRHAAALSATHALRGYDAVHCATALMAASDDFIAVSGDRELLHAWSILGLATVDTSA